MAATKFIIMASGEGTNAQALMECAQANPSLAEVVAVVSDKAQAPVLERARKLDIPAHHIPHRDFAKLESLVTELQPDWALLAGYMRIVGENFLRLFPGSNQDEYRVLNIHPSLLPAFPGLQAFEQAYAANVSESGITVHFVDEQVDHGPIVLQERFAREPDDTLETFIARGRKLEQPLYCKAMLLAAADRLQIETGPAGEKRVKIRSAADAS